MYHNMNTIASELMWRFAFYNNEDKDTVDIDNISIRYHKGYVNTLIVSNNTASC